MFEMEDEYEGIEEDEESGIKFRGLNDGEMTIELSEEQVTRLYTVLKHSGLRAIRSTTQYPFRELIRDRLSLVVDADTRVVKRITLTPIPPKPLPSSTVYFHDSRELWNYPDELDDPNRL